MNSTTEKKPAVSRLFANLDSQGADEEPVAAKADLEFKVKTTLPPRPPKELLDEVAEKNGFDSRQPGRSTPATAQPAMAQDTPASTTPRVKKQRRQRVVRSEQLNMKVTEDTLNRYYALADKLQIPMGELLDRLLKAYESSGSLDNIK
jgi:hypothetical protein